MNYKAEITLNEKDSLYDMLNTEKQIVKVLATAITEGCSKGFRTLVKSILGQSVETQMHVFMLVTECDYCRVKSAEEDTLDKLKSQFTPVKKQLK